MVNEVNWKVLTYTIDDLKNEIESKTIRIPLYQRGVVWDKEDRRDLIDSIKKGYPFGALLIYKDDNGNKQIIDGLQRISTIIDFTKDPGSFFKLKDIDNKVVGTIIEKTNIQGGTSTLKKRLSDIILEWIKANFSSKKQIENLQYHKFYSFLVSKEPVFEPYHEEVINVIEYFFDNIKFSTLDILKKDIPVIEITGDQSVLPKIFDRINTSGKKLSKYEVFRATWIESELQISDERLTPIFDHVRKYYEKIKSIDIQIEGEQLHIGKDKKLSFFDVCYGFGKLLKEKFPALFGFSNNPQKIEGFAFSLINAALGQKNEKLPSLNDKIFSKFNNDDEINEFLVKLLETTEIVNKNLAAFSEFKLNNRKKLDILHTELQIVSIIVAVFLKHYGRYDLDDEDNVKQIQLDFRYPNKEWKTNEKKVFKNNIGKIYLADIISEEWSGTGDKKLDEIVFSPNKYFNEITWDYLKETLSSWYQKQKLERNEYKRVPNANEQDKIVLKVVYMKNFNAKEQLDGSQFDIEHVIPKNLLKKYLRKYEGVLRLPISSIGNLCILPESVNRKKKDKVILDENLDIPSGIKENIAKRYAFVTKENFSFLNKSNHSIREFKDAYFTFIDRRFEKILEEIHAFYFDENASY